MTCTRRNVLIIPCRSSRREPLPYSQRSYRKRHLVENFFQRIVATAQKGSTVYVDPSHVKAHLYALNPAGSRETKAFWLNKGGWNSKISHSLRQTSRDLFQLGRSGLIVFKNTP